MPAEIEVFDDAVPPQLVATLDEIVRMPIWKHGVKSASDDPFSFWFAPFADSEPALEKFSPELFSLWLCVKRLLKGEHKIELAYANGQTYGQAGEIHTDTDAPGHKTVVFYCNSVWQPNWHGETLFYTPDHSDVIKAVLPKPGRVVIFDGNIPHAGRDPSRLCPLIRVTITFKLQSAAGVKIGPPPTVPLP